MLVHNMLFMRNKEVFRLHERNWDCPATKCPDRTGRLEEICTRCSVYTQKDIDSRMTHCEMFPSECDRDSIFCKRCDRYADCYEVFAS